MGCIMKCSNWRGMEEILLGEGERKECRFVDNISEGESVQCNNKCQIIID